MGFTRSYSFASAVANLAAALVLWAGGLRAEQGPVEFTFGIDPHGGLISESFEIIGFGGGARPGRNQPPLPVYQVEQITALTFGVTNHTQFPDAAMQFGLSGKLHLGQTIVHFPDGIGILVDPATFRTTTHGVDLRGYLRTNFFGPNSKVDLGLGFLRYRADDLLDYGVFQITDRRVGTLPFAFLRAEISFSPDGPFGFVEMTRSRIGNRYGGGLKIAF